MPIFRTDHNKSNPYVILSKESLWDSELSLQAVGLWARMMSRPDDWQIHCNELAKSCGVHVQTIYKYVAELEKAGYVTRTQGVGENGKFTDLIYDVHETKKFKNKNSVEILEEQPQTKKPCTVKPCTVISTLLSNEGLLNIEENNISLVGDPKPPTTQRNFSKESKEIAQELWDHIFKLFPKHKVPKIEQWTKEIDLMQRRDRRSWEDIKRAMSFVFEDAFWAKVIQSPDSLRRNFDKIIAKMTPINNTGEKMQRNRSMAHEAKSAIKSNERKWKNFYISNDQIVRLDTNESISLSLDSKIFEAQMIRIFGLTKD